VKIAILHEMLIKFGGAEKVVEKLLQIFPEADLFTLIYDEKKLWESFPKKRINSQVFGLKTQKIYNLFRKQRFCLPFMPSAVESLDFSKYDLVIASSSWFAHWAITKPETQFIVYYHSPARYMWDWTNEYKKDIWWNTWIKWLILNKLFLKLRQWDYIASNRVDTIVANSNNTASRIQKYYRKKSQILYPPVEVKRFQSPVNTKTRYNNYYIIISALTEFKKKDIAMEAFNKIPETNLLIVWSGNHESELENKKKTNNIDFVWTKYWDELVSLVQWSKGLVFPWEEDFWIVPIEVMSAGKPVFAYRWGGLLETVTEWITWEFFSEKNWSDFIENFLKFDLNNQKKIYTSENCIKQAEKFSEDIFEVWIKKLIYKK